MALTTLQDVTRENWRACIRLEMHEHQQGFVASNVATIAESRFEPHFVLRAIYAEDKVVGMLAYCPEDDPPDPTLYWIFRLMIDKHHQGQGIGTAAMRLAIKEIRELGAHKVRTMHKPSNEIAAALYPKLGFQQIGFHDDGDVLLELELQ
ncbi:MAG: GNAT family N-acetyltransferase [Planctomycetaceae bacterium]